MTTATAASDKRIELCTGKHIHFRWEQMLLWGTIAALCGAAFIAGLYFGILECNWHIFSLKHSWDNLFSESWWPVYRHEAFRDIPEPAFAVMFVMTLLAKPKYWAKKVSTLRLVTSPFILIIATFALGIFGTWLLNFAFGRPILQWYDIGDLLLGFGIAHLLRFYWAPVGATLQGHILEGSAQRAAAHHRIPLWVKFPIAPPVLRERFSVLYRAVRNPDIDTPEASSWERWLIGSLVVLGVLITILGFLGHYGEVHGLVLPYIQPVG